MTKFLPVYTDPSLDYLRRHAPDVCYLFGRMEVTDLEMQHGITDERSFAVLLAARLYSTLDDMVEYLRAPTFPVHDLGFVPCAS